jgi:hypothetical protein
MTTPAIDLADIKTIGQVIAAARKILDPGVFTWAASGAGVEGRWPATPGPWAPWL